jgi:hypothetical protein
VLVAKAAFKARPGFGSGFLFAAGVFTIAAASPLPDF